uniref:Doublecortin domain-containing protein n=1 Tax=Glossina brevipalpis TaxID=37001 RepID=A0A1A9WCT9_9MUSC
MSNQEEHENALNGSTNEPSVMDGGRATPQLSTTAQLEQDVSSNTSPTQPYDEPQHHQQQQIQSEYKKANNNNNGNDNHNSNNIHNNNNCKHNNLKQTLTDTSNHSSPVKLLTDLRYRNYPPASDNEDDYDINRATGTANDYWSQRKIGLANSGRQSRTDINTPVYQDNMSENSEQPPVQPLVRSKSRPELSSNAHMNSVMSAASRYSNLSYWKARRVVFYRNGDPFFPGVELRYRPGRDITSLDNLLDKISPKMDLPRGARYVFSMDGDRKYHLDELEDGASYVVSSFKAFKVSFQLEKTTMYSNSLNLHFINS